MMESNNSRAKTNERAAKALDEIEANVAVLDHEGFIVITNKAWREFAVANPPGEGLPPQRVEPGTNYLAVCRDATGPGSENAMLVHAGIRAVLDGKKRSFVHAYPCHSPDRQRWFQMKVKPLRGSRPREAVVIHVDITGRRLAEMESVARQRELSTALAQLQVLAERIKHTIGAEQLPPPAKAEMPEALLPSKQWPTQAKLAMLKSLSRREMEILLGLAQGERNSEIAARLQINKKSVSTYRSRVFEKLKVDNNVELAAFAAWAEILHADPTQA